MAAVNEGKGFEPELASPPVEELMERCEIPESDREEIRRFSQFLHRLKQIDDLKALHKLKELPPAPNGMRDWLNGK